MPAILDYVSDGDWPSVRRNTDATARLLNPMVPQARVFNNAAISIVSATVTALTFNSERFDDGQLHSTSVNTGRLTAPITGLYLFGAAVEFASNATGFRQVNFRLNGATSLDHDSRPAVNGDATRFMSSMLYRLVAGDYVEVLAFQSSGGALNVTAAPSRSPEFWMVRLGGYVEGGL